MIFTFFYYLNFWQNVSEALYLETTKGYLGLRWYIENIFYVSTSTISSIIESKNVKVSKRSTGQGDK